MSQQRAVIFDLETVPDLASARRLLGLASCASDEGVRRALGERYAKNGEQPETAFIKIALQKIVGLGAIYAERHDSGLWTITRSGVIHVGMRPERELLAGFFESLTEGPSPQLAGFNSSSFDLPVLRYRAFALELSARPICGGNGKDYWYRYGKDHLDMCDAISSFGASSKPSLAELAALAGISAKEGNVDGSQVESMVAGGKLDQVAAYCDTDIFSTYYLFLRFCLVTSALNSEAYIGSIDQILHHISSRLHKRPHLKAFADSLESIIRDNEVKKT